MNRSNKVELPYSTYGIKALRNHAAWKSIICSPHLILDEIYSLYILGVSFSNITAVNSKALNFY